MSAQQPIQTGCYISGVWGWHSIARILDVAAEFGVEIKQRDVRLMHAYDRGWTMANLAEVVTDIADDYERQINDHLPDGYVASWYEGEFFVMHDDE